MNALLKFVAKQLFGQKGVIANNKAVNFEAAKLAEKLSEFGIDPNSIKTEKQLEGIVNQIKELQKKRMAESMEVISQDDPRFKGIMDKMMGSNVIKRDFGKPFKEEIKKMKSDEEILSNIKKSNERSVQNLRMQMMDDKVANDMFQGGPSRDPKTDADMLAEFIAEDAGKIYDDLDTKEKIKFYDRAYNAILRYKRKDPEDMADGGRIGFKKGMDRRTFMKMVGGLTALPILGKFFKGAEVAAPVAEKAVEAAKGVPPYFFDLVNKIKIFGKQRQTPSYKERVNEYTYTGKDGIEYELVEDLDTGEIMIKKDKMGVASSGDQSYDVIEDRTEMVFKKGRADETTKGTPVDEYEEYKVEFDADGTAADATDVDEISKSEIIKEVSADTPAIKKAGGGIARMLGE